MPGRDSGRGGLHGYGFSFAWSVLRRLLYISTTRASSKRGAMLVGIVANRDDEIEFHGTDVGGGLGMVGREVDAGFCHDPTARGFMPCFSMPADQGSRVSPGR